MSSATQQTIDIVAPVLANDIDTPTAELVELVQKKVKGIKKSTIARAVYKAKKLVESGEYEAEQADEPEEQQELPAPKAKKAKKAKKVKKAKATKKAKAPKAEKKLKAPKKTRELPKLTATELVVLDDFSTFEAGSEGVDITRRTNLRSMLQAFVEAGPGGELTVSELLQAGWPKTKETDTTKRRVYEAIFQLRDMGLKGIIVNATRGCYMLHPSVTIEMVEAVEGE
ncbi:MAG: hypothetical protein ACF8MF_06690 [Phycisphaerales bacterium JB052]